MEENNNNQPVSLETPVTPVAPEAPVMPEAPVAPVAPEADHMEVHPVPSLVIEDTAEPEAPVAPVAPEAPVEVVAPEAPVMPEAPVAPVAPEAPVMPEAPAEPVVATPEVPVEPVAPAIPEAPVTPAEPVAPATPETPVTPEAPAVAPATPETAGTEAPAKKKSNLVPIIIILLCVVAGVAIVYFRNKSSEPTPTPTPTPTPQPEPEPTPGGDVTTLSLNQAALNGVTFSFPETKTAFSNVGWTWDANYASNDVAAGTTTNGGRIGTAPGGAVVQVVNKGTEPAHIEDCTIYSATFYNPKDGSENVTFVGGLGYTSNEEAVRAKMTELGYSKVTETPSDNGVTLRYFLNNDTTNTNNYIEFSFVSNTIENVTITTPAS